MAVLLKVDDLRTQFMTERGLVKAVDGVSYDIHEGEIVGLVGESGCGKSVSQLSLLQLIPNPPGKIVGGKAIFEGQDILQYEANGAEMRAVRGGKIAMIFQEPMTSLNPAMTISRQLSEVMQLHLNMDAQAAREEEVHATGRVLPQLLEVLIVERDGAVCTSRVAPLHLRATAGRVDEPLTAAVALDVELILHPDALHDIGFRCHGIGEIGFEKLRDIH